MHSSPNLRISEIDCSDSVWLNRDFLHALKVLGLAQNIYAMYTRKYQFLYKITHLNWLFLHEQSNSKQTNFVSVSITCGRAYTSSLLAENKLGLSCAKLKLS